MTVALLVMGLLAGVLGLLSHRLGATGWAERPSVDERFRLRGETPPNPNVVVVALDAKSYRELPQPPLPRMLDARLVERLNQAGADVVAFDFALERPTTDPHADDALVSALTAARHAVVSVTAVQRGGGTAPLAGRAPFANTGVLPGVTLLPLDGDGAVRQFPQSLGGVESFAVASARDLRRGVGTAPPAGALIDYPGPPGTVPALSFADVLDGHFRADAVRGKVVVVGPSAPVLQDIHRSPVGAAMTGPEIQADAISTALGGFPLREARAFVTAGVLLGLGLTVPLLTLLLGWARRRRGPRGAAPLGGVRPDAMAVMVVGTLAVIGWSLAGQLAFDTGTVLDYADGLLTIGLATVGTWITVTIIERREHMRLRVLFAAASPEVVELVLRPTAAQTSGVTAESVIAGYLLKDEIGRGGMGVVYRASQLRLERPVALKLIRPEMADLPSYRASFEDESKLAAAVSHPNVIPVIDAGEDKGLLYLVMQLIEGINLADVLTAAGPLTTNDASHLLHQIAGALDALHAKGLVHRDVKPGNIVLRTEDPSHALLTDFGLAKDVLAGDQSSPSEGWAGTIDYLAPEQLSGLDVDRGADVYALSAVLYHCLTGMVPFPSESEDEKIAAHLTAPRPSPSQLRPELPCAIDRVIMRGMAILPSARQSTAGEFAADMRSAFGFGSRAAIVGHTPATGSDQPRQHTPTQASGAG